MAQLLRPLRQWPRLHHYRCCASATLPLHHHHQLLRFSTAQPTKSNPPYHFSFSPLASSSHRNLHSRPRGLRIPSLPLPTEPDNGSGSDSGGVFDPEPKKSRNQLKLEAQRRVLWGMELASFSIPQIKLILRVASLDQAVFDALMVIKRLGSDIREGKRKPGPNVREGKRRQFNYIGKLLQEAEPELMDRLIKATREADHKELQALSGLGPDDLKDDGGLIETEFEEYEEESTWHDSQVTRWFDGLLDKDIQITNEVYSVQGVDFDRQELRKLVRRVHATLELKAANEEEENKLEKATIGAKKALTRFLRGLAKRIPDEYKYIN